MDNQLRLGRVVLENVEDRNQTTTVDLVFQGNEVKRGVPYYGIWEDRSQGARCPFVLDDNGECDFGTSYDGDDRIYETDLLEVPISIGQQIGWRSGDYETRMKVVGVTQLV
jgi:hypothetical protein